VARGGCHAWGCGRSAHAPPTQFHGPFRPTYFHPGLLQRARPVRRRDGAAPPRRGPSQGARAGAHCAGAVASRGRGGGHGPERVRGDAQPSLRSQRGLGPRCKRRPSTDECPPFRPRPPPGTARALGGGAPHRRAPGGLGPLEPLVTPKRRGDPAGAPCHLPPPRGLELPASLMVADSTPLLSVQAASWSVRCGRSAPARSCASRTWRRACPPPSVRRTCSHTLGSSAAALAVQRNDGAIFYKAFITTLHVQRRPRRPGPQSTGPHARPRHERICACTPRLHSLLLTEPLTSHTCGRTRV